MSYLDTGNFREYATFLVGACPRCTEIACHPGNTSWRLLSGAPQETSTPLPDIPEKRNAEAVKKAVKKASEIVSPLAGAACG
jgi:hypothetical protein